jgi:preprotein translocase subunit SecB
MTEEQNPDQVIPPEQAAGAQLQIQKIYTKDVSFEIPNAPKVFQEQGQADVKLSLSQRVEELGENLEEITLTVTVTATIGEKTAYLAEVAQAGIFLINGFPEQARHAVVNTFCPNTLFPYARTSITNLVADGGFPPLTLQPVNFEQLYAQRMQQMAAEQQAQSNGAGNEESVPAEFTSTDD